MARNIEHKVEKKICKAKKHQFIVTGWRIWPNKQTSTELTCQHCLMTVDRTNVEVVNKLIDDEIEVKPDTK